MKDKNNQRALWSSRIGFILAASGSAVGLGNIWKFPYVTGQNGGGAFVLVYMICTAIIGLPLMLSEFAIGRNANLNPIGAFNKIKPNSPWIVIGIMGLLGGFLVLSFYSVVGGWTLAYLVKSLTHGFDSFTTSKNAESIFLSFTADATETLFYQILFISISIYIVLKGVDKGIEKICDILMPTLVIMLAILMIRSITLPGAVEGLKFYLYPDFSKINGSVILIALGQSFFSLSLGMGCLITYGSYLRPQENLISVTVYIVIFDILIALLMGMIIFPAVFAMGMEPTEGPSLVFNVLPVIFKKMSIGGIFSIIFFCLLTIAAITSSISLLEGVTSFLIDKYGWKRKNAVLITALAIFLFGIPSALSFGLLENLKLANMTFFDLINNITSNYLLPLSGMLTAVFVGWVWGVEKVQKEIENNTSKSRWPQIWIFLVKFITPLALAIVFLSNFF